MRTDILCLAFVGLLAIPLLLILLLELIRYLANVIDKSNDSRQGFEVQPKPPTQTSSAHETRGKKDRDDDETA